MKDKPITDQYELIERSVSAHMRPFIEATMMEHEHTRTKIQQNTDLVRKVASRHMWVRDVAIAVLYIGVIFLLTGCTPI